MHFLAHIESIIPVSAELRAKINTIALHKEVAKGHVLVNQGQRCSELYFIEQGLVRGFYVDNGKEITSWFAQENEFATCFYSFISKAPSFESIQALEDCELVQINYTALQALYSEFPETERIGRLFTELYYLKLDGRFLNIQFKTAKERYQNLLAGNPSLVQRASLGQIASYLGITQETLSRIRAEL